MLKKLVIVVLCSLLHIQCDVNPLEMVSTGKDTTAAKLEKARLHLDAKEYSQAHAILTGLTADPATDSNEIRLLLSAATLGASGLEVWSLITELLSGNTTIESGGMATILSSVTGAVLGTGEELERKLTALDESVTLLRASPDPTSENVNNMACVLAGIAVSPSMGEATATFTRLQTAVDTINSSAGSCTAVSDLATTISEVSELSARFSQVMTLSEECPFLAIDTSATSGIDSILGTLSSNADLGCNTSSNQFLPSCLVEQASTDVGTAVANDGNIATCELIYNCFTPTGLSACFSS